MIVFLTPKKTVRSFFLSRVVLTYFQPTFLFYTPENMGKPQVEQGKPSRRRALIKNGLISLYFGSPQNGACHEIISAESFFMQKLTTSSTTHKRKFSIKYFFSKYGQIGGNKCYRKRVFWHILRSADQCYCHF